jgi:hypothetical protein
MVFEAEIFIRSSARLSFGFWNSYFVESLCVSAYRNESDAFCPTCGSLCRQFWPQSMCSAAVCLAVRKNGHIHIWFRVGIFISEVTDYFIESLLWICHAGQIWASMDELVHFWPMASSSGEKTIRNSQHQPEDAWGTYWALQVHMDQRLKK